MGFLWEEMASTPSSQHYSKKKKKHHITLVFIKKSPTPLKINSLNPKNRRWIEDDVPLSQKRVILRFQPLSFVWKLIAPSDLASKCSCSSFNIRKTRGCRIESKPPKTSSQINKTWPRWLRQVAINFLKICEMGEVRRYTKTNIASKKWGSWETSLFSFRDMLVLGSCHLPIPSSTYRFQWSGILDFEVDGKPLDKTAWNFVFKFGKAKLMEDIWLTTWDGAKTCRK